jgi:hypothetical protein
MFTNEVDYRKLSERVVKRARKEHKCDVCKQPIKAGSRYYRVAALVDGKFYVDRMHDYNGSCLDVH